jgi:hypothetical protein
MNGAAREHQAFELPQTKISWRNTQTVLDGVVGK